MRSLIIISIVCLASCTPTLPTYTTKITGNAIQVSVGGFENSDVNVITDESGPFDILLIKRSPLAFDALYLKCSYDTARLSVTSINIVCPKCHSTYNFDGAAQQPPATSSLLKFPTELSPDQTTVRINIQSLGL